VSFTFYWKKMNKEMNCPRCQSLSVVQGRYLDQLAGGLGQNFRMKELRLFAFGGTDVATYNGGTVKIYDDFIIITSPEGESRLALHDSGVRPVSELKMVQ